MKKLLLITFLFFCGMMSFAQSGVNIEITIHNDNGEAMQNVSVRSEEGYLLGVSDWRGEVTIHSVKTGDVLHFSHVAYHEMEHVINKDNIKDKSLTVKMFMKFHNLPEVTVVENVPHVAYNNKVVSIADYEINNQGIYLLAHRMRHYSLLHLSFDFDTLAEIKLPRKFDHFYKDVYDQIHVVSQDSAYWVGTMKRGDEYVGMKLTMGINIDQFYYIHAHVSAATDQVIITHLYTNRGQELYYFDIGQNEEKKIDTTVLEHIRWEEGCMLMANVRKFGPMGWRGEAQSLFEKPIYDPVFNMNNEIFVFNFEDNIINHYDNRAEKMNTFPLTFHKQNSWNNKVRLVEGWNKKVLMDERNSSFYAVFLNHGITTLKKIDVAHGTVSNSAVFGGFPFIEKLKVYNGKAYFLFANDYTNNKRLYEVAIE
ncbi:MAG: hypothetical protein IKU01_02225 [Bacteroidales bacterium]|nr:hypothetical protein [Bacteroidales bacterium]